MRNTSEDRQEEITELAANFGRALIALITALIVFALKVLTPLISGIAASVRLFASYAPWIARGLAALAAILSVLWAWPRLFTAYGGDFSAIIPASLLCGVPMFLSAALVRSKGVDLAGVIAMGALSVFGVGYVLPELDPMVRGAVFAVLGLSAALRNLYTSKSTEEAKSHERSSVRESGT